MGYIDRTNDWEAVSIAQLGGADIVGGGAWLFKFQSPANNYCCSMAFFGAGFGAGAIGGVNFPNVRRVWEQFTQKKGPKAPALAFSKIQVDREFSASDLNWSYGMIAYMGASGVVGYSAMVITASNTIGSLFSSQVCQGPGLGFGVGALHVQGMWKWVNDWKIN